MPANEEDVIKLDWNDAKMVRWTSNVRFGNKISATELWNKLKI